MAAAAGGDSIVPSAATATFLGCPLGANTLTTPEVGLVLRLPPPLPPLPAPAGGDLHPASMKSLLWLMTPWGCALGLLAAVTLSVCSVARRLAMLLLSSAPIAASREAAAAAADPLPAAGE